MSRVLVIKRGRESVIYRGLALSLSQLKCVILGKCKHPLTMQLENDDVLGSYCPACDRYIDWNPLYTVEGHIKYIERITKEKPWASYILTHIPHKGGREG